MSVFTPEDACSPFGVKSMPSSPSLPKSGHIEFKRMVSGASTCLPSPDIDFQDFDRQVSEAADSFNLPASQFEVDHVRLVGGHSTSDTDAADSNISDDKEQYLDDDGVLWVQTTACQYVGSRSRDDCAWTMTSDRYCMETMEEKLAELKCLYHEKFGMDADSEDEMYDSRLQRCQKSLHEMESLFERKYGHDINDVDEDGCVWIETAGSSSMDTLDEKLEEVKCPYHETFGTDADATYDSQLQRSQDDCVWIDTTGRSILDMLKDKLEEVKCMYNDKFCTGGELIEGEYQCRLMQCQDLLQQVAALYEQKYGHGIDELDEDGFEWAKTPEPGRLERLEEKLAEVQLLYRDKYGHDLNCGSYEDRVQSTTDLVKEVKALYAQKYGHAVDDLDEDGCGNTELKPLQAVLNTTEALSHKKYGHDVDDCEIFTGCHGCSKPSEV
mmetsp:Transcript_61258/g.121276  ORF Transcript_61258/g.121276 Transcript_61258/m.121276 type:complete len:440 (-) Transcript_61258:105-1424(-)